jgi:DNA-binding NarL/FixJ family response regulator
VLGYLARGHSNKQIAQRLVVAPRTVSNHVEHIYTKFGSPAAPPRRCSRPSTVCWAPSNPRSSMLPPVRRPQIPGRR